MTTRSLSVLVFSLVLGTALMVGWYLEGERTTSAAERAPDAQPRIEHVWRSHPGAVSTRRNRGRSGTLTSIRARSQAAPARVPSLAAPAPSQSAGSGESAIWQPQASN